MLKAQNACIDGVLLILWRADSYAVGTTGVAFVSPAQARGYVLTTILIVAAVVVGFAIVAGGAWAMMRMERSSRQRVERQREAWRASGSIGPEPGRWGGSRGGPDFGG